MELNSTDLGLSFLNTILSASHQAWICTAAWLCTYGKRLRSLTERPHRIAGILKTVVGCCAPSGDESTRQPLDASYGKI